MRTKPDPKSWNKWSFHFFKYALKKPTRHDMKNSPSTFKNMCGCFKGGKLLKNELHIKSYTISNIWHSTCFVTFCKNATFSRCITLCWWCYFSEIVFLWTAMIWSLSGCTFSLAPSCWCSLKTGNIHFSNCYSKENK